jgi:hypothetical protein
MALNCSFSALNGLWVLNQGVDLRPGMELDPVEQRLVGNWASWGRL